MKNTKLWIKVTALVMTAFMLLSTFTMAILYILNVL